MSSDEPPLIKPNDHDTQVSVAASTKTEVRRTVVNVTGLFAVIGAIAAVMQIYQLLNKDEPVLHGEVHLSESFIPEGSKVTLTPEEEALWPYTRNDSVAKYCNRRTDEGRTNFYKNDENCQRVESITNKVEKSIKHGQQVIARSAVTLANSGRDAAENVKVRSPAAGHITISDQADKVIANRDIGAGDVVTLPSLNPSESVKIILDVEQSPFQAQIDRPPLAITHAKGKASLSTYRVVPPLFADMADLVDGVPKFILVILFLGLCFIVTVAMIMIIAVVNAIIRGKSIASVFQT